MLPILLQWGHRLTSVETREDCGFSAGKHRFNGATDLHRWKRCWASDRILYELLLQWGHRLTSVETEYITYYHKRFDTASMGPPTYIGGNSMASICHTNNGYLLQWGHRLTSVETALRSSGVKPCLWMLQWGHRLTSVETGQSKHQHRPQKQLQWGHRLTSVETSPSSIANCHFLRRFNGATDLHRWKHDAGIKLYWDTGASMGPPTYIGGNCVCQNAQQNHYIKALQWGHRLTSVETDLKRIGGTSYLIASMGPPTYIGGNNRG